MLRNLTQEEINMVRYRRKNVQATYCEGFLRSLDQFETAQQAFTALAGEAKELRFRGPTIVAIREGICESAGVKYTVADRRRKGGKRR